LPLNFRGSVRLVRPFGYPGRLDEFEHVWLTCAGVGETEIALNGQSLGGGEGNLEFEVTPLLGPRNRLEMTLVVDDPVGDVWDEVALEIRRAAYLRARACRRGSDAVEVSGAVIGPAGPELELYALVDGRNVHYQKIAPEPMGRAFQFQLRGIDATGVSVKLDLVDVATSWYTVEVPVTC
jgi:hypothetical protein